MQNLWGQFWCFSLICIPEIISASFGPQVTISQKHIFKHWYDFNYPKRLKYFLFSQNAKLVLLNQTTQYLNMWRPRARLSALVACHQLTAAKSSKMFRTTPAQLFSGELRAGLAVFSLQCLLYKNLQVLVPEMRKWLISRVKTGNF